MTETQQVSFSFALKKLAGLVKPFRWTLIVCAVASFVSVAFSVVAPAILAKAIDLIVTGVTSTKGQFDSVYFSTLLLLCVGLYIVSAMAVSLQSWLLAGVSSRIGLDLRNQMNEKLNRLPMDYFDTHRSGDTLALIMNDINAITIGLNQFLPQLINGTLSVIGALTIMLLTDWVMTVCVLAVIPISGILLPAITARSQKYLQMQQETVGQTTGYCEEQLAGHSIVKAFNREKESIEEFKQLNEQLQLSTRLSLFYSGLVMPMMFFAMNCGYIVLIVAGGLCTVWGRITIGEIQAFVQYSHLFTQPLGQLAGIACPLQQMFASIQRIAVLMETPEESIDKSVDTCPLAPNAETIGEVRFENIRFGYNPQQDVIRNFSLTVKSGQKVAIVGPTGAGKTTLVKLLMRFYDVNAGRITVDGTDIREMPRHTLRKQFGMVLQDTWLFHDTIRENIRYGNIADKEQIVIAAKNAYADDFIRKLPDGYDLILSEGADNISQGQKQLLTIARALLPNPKMMILDEATSAVDTYTELLLQKAMSQLMIGRTSFVIAHRLSTIKDADVILAMRDGDIVEQGTHEELLAKNGFYAKLYNSQFAID